MSNEKILESLRNMKLFDGVSDEHLQRLEGISRLVDFNPLSTIFREKEPAKEVYLIVEGTVSLITCTPKVGCRKLMEAGAGDLIGWSPLVGRTRLTDTAQTNTHTSVIAVDGEKLLTLFREHPEFGFAFMHRVAQVLAQRLTATRMQLLDMTGHHLPEMPIESD